MTWLIEYRKELAKITAKSGKKARQSSETNTSDLKLQSAKTILMKFC